MHEASGPHIVRGKGAWTTKASVATGTRTPKRGLNSSGLATTTIETASTPQHSRDATRGGRLVSQAGRRSRGVGLQCRTIGGPCRHPSVPRPPLYANPQRVAEPTHGHGGFVLERLGEPRPSPTVPLRSCYGSWHHLARQELRLSEARALLCTTCGTDRELCYWAQSPPLVDLATKSRCP